jgi:hypothetical protein
MSTNLTDQLTHSINNPLTASEFDFAAVLDDVLTTRSNSNPPSLARPARAFLRLCRNRVLETTPTGTLKPF